MIFGMNPAIGSSNGKGSKQEKRRENQRTAGIHCQI